MSERTKILRVVCPHCGNGTPHLINAEHWQGIEVTICDACEINFVIRWNACPEITGHKIEGEDS